MSKMQISGGMTTSARAGNGLWFDHEALAEMAKSKPQAPYVRDHGMDLKDVAGHVRSITAERFDIEVPIIKKEASHGADAEKTTIREKATRLYHTSLLSADFPAFTEVSAHIAAMSAAGQVPQESIALQAVSLSYEPATDRLFLDGPYMLIHHSSVSKGAFGPEDGVGIESVSLQPTLGAAFTVGSGEPTLVSVMQAGKALVTNMPDLVHAFAITHAANPAALKAAMRAGLNVEQHAVGTGTIEPAALSAEALAAIAAASGATHADSNTASPPSPDKDSKSPAPGEPRMPNEPPAPPAGAGTTPAQPSAAELEALVSAQVEKRFNAEKATRDAAALVAKRQHIVDTYSVDESVVKTMDATALDGFEAHLRNQDSVGLIRRAPKGDAPNAAHWKALDEGRDAFVKRTALVTGA